MRDWATLGLSLSHAFYIVMLRRLRYQFLIESLTVLSNCLYVKSVHWLILRRNYCFMDGSNGKSMSAMSIG
jgi:hypothetical protein